MKINYMKGGNNLDFKNYFHFNKLGSLDLLFLNCDLFFLRVFKQYTVSSLPCLIWGFLLVVLFQDDLDSMEKKSASCVWDR